MTNNGRPLQQMRSELGWSVEGSQAQLSAQAISLPEVIPHKPQARLPRRRVRRSRLKPPVSSPSSKMTAAPSVLPRMPSARKPSVKPVQSAPPQRRVHGRGRWKLPMLFVTGISITGGLGVLSLVWLTTLPPMPECDRVTLLSPDTEQLYCAQEAARSGNVKDLKAAVELVQDWTPRHPLYTESQQWLGRWSRTLLEMARQRYSGSDLKGALELAALIPQSSPSYGNAQETITDWQAEWQEGEAIYTLAQQALKDQDWGTASQQLLALGQVEAPYWREQQMSRLTEQIFVERTSWTALQEAQKLAQRETAENLQGALVKVGEISPQTYAWGAAQADRQRWGNTLATLGLQQWQGGDTGGAIALAQAIPTDLSLEGEAANLVRYGHAHHLASWQVEADWMPSPAQIWRLREAIAALQSIPRSSAFYDPAQTQLENWQAQLQDVTQLQLATTIASLGQRQALELAITQANRIGLERPRRQQAQTLIAYWTGQIQRLQDMPILVRAQDLATAGTIPELQRAIALAESIGTDRALHEEAQAAIITWVAKIQTIEDQPTLDQARQYAKQGQLRRAIREARKIPEGRALYAEAQAAADGWQAEIDRVLIAEDRKILDQANGLAGQGSLTRAIDTASQIGRDRPLYAEAQASIQQWQDERAAVWETWETQETAPLYPSEPVEPAPEPAPEWSDTPSSY